MAADATASPHCLSACTHSSCTLISMRSLFSVCLSETAESRGGGFSWPGTTALKSFREHLSYFFYQLCCGAGSHHQRDLTSCCMGARKSSNIENLQLFSNNWFSSICPYPFILLVLFPQYCLLEYFNDSSCL